MEIQKYLIFFLEFFRKFISVGIIVTLLLLFTYTVLTLMTGHMDKRIEPLSIEYSELVADEEDNSNNNNSIRSSDSRRMDSLLFCGKWKLPSDTIVFIVVFITLVAILIVSVSLSVRGSSKGSDDGFNVVLFGDSLIGYTETSYQIASKIRSNVLMKHPDININMYTSGVGGNRIADLKKRMYRDALHKNYFQFVPTQPGNRPDAIIMYWDSDATDVDETGHVTEIRAEYTANLYDVLSTLKTQVKFFAFGGPTLYGEKPHGLNRRDDILDDYVIINRNAARDLNITYLETRALFWSHLPKDWDQDRGFLTLDGEHMNEAGAQLLVDLFSDLISNWLSDI